MAGNPQTTEKKKKKFWVAFRIFISVLVIWLFCLIARPRNLLQEKRMINVCHEQIKDRLYAPSTAIFSKTEIKQHPIRWPVVHWIEESQNWFWGVRKHEYYCYYRNKDWDWKFRDVAFENNGDDDEIFRMLQADFDKYETY